MWLDSYNYEYHNVSNSGLEGTWHNEEQWNYDLMLMTDGVHVVCYCDAGDDAMNIFNQCKEELILIYGEPKREGASRPEAYYSGNDIGVSLVLQNEQVKIGIGPYEYMKYWIE